VRRGNYGNGSGRMAPRGVAAAVVPLVVGLVEARRTSRAAREAQDKWVNSDDS